MTLTFYRSRRFQFLALDHCCGMITTGGHYQMSRPKSRITAFRLPRLSCQARASLVSQLCLCHRSLVVLLVRRLRAAKVVLPANILHQLTVVDAILVLRPLTYRISRPRPLVDEKADIRITRSALACAERDCAVMRRYLRT